MSCILIINSRALFVFTNTYAILDVKNSRHNRKAREQRRQQVSEANADRTENPTANASETPNANANANASENPNPNANASDNV